MYVKLGYSLIFAWFLDSDPKKAQIWDWSGQKMVQIFNFWQTRISEMVIGSPVMGPYSNVDVTKVVWMQ